MKVRIISALVVVAIVLPFIYFGKMAFAFLVGIVSVLGYKEVLDLKKTHSKIPIIPSIIGLVSLLLIVYTNFDGHSLVYGVTYSRLIILIIGMLIPTIFYSKDTYTIKDAFNLIGMILLLGIGFNSLILIRNIGIEMFIYLILVPICTDTFAMILGSLIGKHKMCPKISPKKSWEGFGAGLILGTLIPGIFYYFVIGQFSFRIIILTLLLSLLGQAGDLIFSKIKRENDVKDFSNIMPGHGGILDRLDSTMIIFISYIWLISILF